MAKDEVSKEEVAEQLGAYEDENISYMNYMEVRGTKGVDPLSPEGLRIQADYLAHLKDGHHPFDVARRLSLNPWCSPRDRLAAAKLLLEYTTRKVPAQVEVSGNNGQAIKLDSSALKNLNGSELDTLIALIEKANTGVQE